MQLLRAIIIIGFTFSFLIQNATACGLETVASTSDTYNLVNPCTEATIDLTLPLTVKTFNFFSNKNLIGVISNYDFSKFESGISLYLDNTGITEIPQADHLPANIKILSTWYNTLNQAALKVYDFKKFTDPEFRLILSNTGITEIPPLENLPATLYTLSVKENTLDQAKLALYDFRKFGSITYGFSLVLEQTGITHIPSVDKLPEFLNYFGLKNNPLDQTAFLAYNFSKFSRLLQLDLRNTGITNLPPADHFPANFIALYLDGNALNCMDCTTMTTLFAFKSSIIQYSGFSCTIPTFKPVCSIGGFYDATLTMPTTTSPTAPSTNTTAPSSNEISVGAIIGISIGGFVIFSGMVYFIATRFFHRV